MKLARTTLQEILDGRKATKAEIESMASELAELRDEEAKRDDGTQAVTLEHAGKEGMSGWFAPRSGRLLRSQLHVGARFTLAGRVYGIVSVDGDRVRVR